MFHPCRYAVAPSGGTIQPKGNPLKRILCAAILMFAALSAVAELSTHRSPAAEDPIIVLERASAVPSTSSLVTHFAVLGDGPVSVYPTDFAWQAPTGADAGGGLHTFLFYREGGVSQSSFTFQVICGACEVNAQMIDVPGATIASNSWLSNKLAAGTYFVDGDLDEVISPYVIGFHTVVGRAPHTSGISSGTGTNWMPIANVGDDDGSFGVNTDVLVFEATTGTTQYVAATLTRLDSPAHGGWLVWTIP
jgi:hypothetical protein